MVRRSVCVRTLVAHDLVVCINPEAPNYRRYRLTDYGGTVLAKLRDKNE